MHTSMLFYGFCLGAPAEHQFRVCSLDVRNVDLWETSRETGDNRDRCCRVCAAVYIYEGQDEGSLLFQTSRAE